MALRDFVKSGGTPPATVATVATVEGEAGRSVAEVATVAGVSGQDRSEERRQRVLALFAESPGRRYAVVNDDGDPAYPGCVVLGVGILQDDGGITTCDIVTPAERYDGCALLDLIDRHAQGSA